LEFARKEVDRLADASRFMEMSEIRNSGIRRTFDNMISKVQPDTWDRSGTVPIPMACASELSPRVTGCEGWSGWYVRNQDQCGTICDDAPESMISVLLLLSFCSDEE